MPTGPDCTSFSTTLSSSVSHDIERAASAVSRWFGQAGSSAGWSLSEGFASAKDSQELHHGRGMVSAGLAKGLECLRGQGTVTSLARKRGRLLLFLPAG